MLDHFAFFLAHLTIVNVNTLYKKTKAQNNGWVLYCFKTVFYVNKCMQFNSNRRLQMLQNVLFA